MSTKTKIGVLMGGVSHEHEVSINSGTGVMNAIDRNRFEPVAITITKSGEWVFGEEVPRSIYEAVPELRDRGIDALFIALHGPNGEDGRIQGMLDLLGIPYTGSGCAASALAMDKVRSKAVVQAQGVRVAGHVALDRPTWAADRETVFDTVSRDIGFPCVVKASNQGSSFGLEIPQDIKAFEEAMDRIFETNEYIMVEEYITGVELTCAVMDAEPHGMIRPLPVTEIKPKHATYFDYEAKYTPGATEEITPARIPSEVAERVQDAAVYVHEIVGCRGWSRSDFILDESGPVWLEVNTVPGLTETSLYPQAAAAAGISYSQMITLFIDRALRDAQYREQT